ncbi:membrane protein, PF09925 family [Acinetobacter baumannii Naval-72]|nr:membrane protein, PF09925 family [Acinetobacter baumannii Naval-72]
MALSILYLIAANWLMLPDSIQLIIPPVILLMTAWVSIKKTLSEGVRQTLHGICGLMVGLSLAVIGQVYQTGADSYLLFLIWTLLLLPWLYRPNIGIFALICITSQLTLFLFFKQTFWAEKFPYLYLFALNLLSLVQFWICQKKYTALRFIFIAWFAVISITGMIQFLSSENLPYLISAFFLGIIAFYYFFNKDDQLCASLMAAVLGVTATIWLVDGINQLFKDSNEFIFLLIAGIIFTWFALISYFLIKIFRQSRFYIIPLAIGAWLAGLALAAFTLVFWETISLIIGIIFVAVAITLLTKSQSYFIQQFAYCLFVSGQTAFLFHLGSETDQILWVLIAQIFILCISYFLKPHWFFILIQMLATYGIAVIYLLQMDHSLWSLNSTQTYLNLVLLNYLVFSSVLLIGSKAVVSYKRSIFLCTLVVIWVSSFFDTFIGLAFVDSADQSLWLLYALPCVWLLCFSFFYLYRQLHGITFFAFLVFGILLIALGYFEVFILFVILTWALKNKDRIVYGVTLVVFAFVLWQLYYSLQLSFLAKSASILVSGIILLALYGLLMKEAKINCIEGEK